MVESGNLLLILDRYKTLYLHKYINTAKLNSIVNSCFNLLISVATFKFVTNVHIYI